MGLFTNICFSSGDSVQLEHNGIVVLVGPNNAGKSQALKDIYSNCKNEAATNVVTSVGIELPPQKEIEFELANYSRINDNGLNKQYEGAGYRFNSVQFYGLYNTNGRKAILDSLTPFLVSRLSTEERLSLVFPPNSIGAGEKKDHPIHYLIDSPEQQERLSSYFERAFGIPLSVDILNGSTVPLRLGSLPSLSTFHTEKTMTAITEAKRAMSQKPMLHEQGDGMRSFVGILLNFLIVHRKAFLVDEPESFLHPPQAHILGQIIGELLGDKRQCIVATHSRDLIQGLIETCPERVQVVRVTRTGNTNPINVLDSAQIARFLSDPILKYSDIMDSMFHESVVLCESDSDCMMYSIVYSYLSKEKGRLPQTQFIHCGGKARMSVVVDALRALGIEFRVIPDLDILNDRTACSKLFISCGGNWDDVKRDYTIATSAINQKRQKVRRVEVGELIDSHSDDFLSKQEIKAINSLFASGKPWSSVKQNGFNSFPGGDANNAAMNLKHRFEEVGIYLVPVGELEAFNKASGKHGPQWVAEVLAVQPDLGNPSYDSLRNFVMSWNL